MHFIYSFFLTILSIILFPKYLYASLVEKKYRHTWKERFGMGFTSGNRLNKPVIWIHAVSVGETKAVSALALRLKENPDHFFVISTTTETGQAEAKRSLAFADQFLVLPLDFRCIIGPIVKKINPALFVLTESDYWFNLLDCVKDCGAKVVVVNGKISERSAKRMGWVSWFAKSLFERIDLMCVQSSHYRDRFARIGVPAEKLLVTGNLKFDEKYLTLTEEEKNTWQTRLGILPFKDQVIVVGSCHDPEERLFLEVFQELWKEYPFLKAVFVPRHPERFDKVEELIAATKVPYLRYSKGFEGDVEPKVILVDQMGVLRACYQLADIAIVAGSYTEKVGGHNILEPSFFGVPVVFGPCMHSQPELLTLMLENKAGYQVKAEDLVNVLGRLLKDLGERKHLGEAGVRFVQANQGALQRTYNAILNIYHKS